MKPDKCADLYRVRLDDLLSVEVDMWDMLYAFGIGTSFAVGIAFGAWLSRMATKEGRAEWREETRQQHETVVGLLTKKNEVLEAMLVTMQGMDARNR